MQFTSPDHSYLPGLVPGPGNTKMNKAKPLRACPAFIPLLKQICCVSLSTGDRASSGDIWQYVLSHVTIHAQEPSEPANPMVNDFDVHESDAFLHFPGDWGVGKKEV